MLRPLYQTGLETTFWPQPCLGVGLDHLVSFKSLRTGFDVGSSAKMAKLIVLISGTDHGLAAGGE